jgi:hypothetical protein
VLNIGKTEIGEICDNLYEKGTLVRTGRALVLGGLAKHAHKIFVTRIHFCKC